MRLVYGNEMQELDRYTIEEFGIPGLILMENAGRGVTEIILEKFAPEAANGVIIVCGPGNNGGDGFVIARHLAQRGYPVQIFSLAPEEKFRGDALVNLKIVQKMSLPLKYILQEHHVSELESALKSAGLVIDAIFGTGLAREVTGRFAKAIDFINQAERPVVSVDIPSGLSAQTGKPLGIAVRATLTATMALPKVGQVIYPGREYVGELHIVDISMPWSVILEKSRPREWLDMSWAIDTLRPRHPDTHKGTYGHLMVLAGSTGKTGAAILACLGALHGGAGLITLVCPEGLDPLFEVTLIETMTYPLPYETPEGSLSIEAYEAVSEFARNKRAALIGPGFGLHPSTVELSQKISAELPLPLVIDADAIRALSGQLYHLRRAQNPRIITPHPGEMAHLLQVNKEEILQNRLHAARAAAREANAVVVLKGAATIISAPDGREAINSTGNPGLASGGTGDVLAGLIASLLSQGYEAFEAACLGVFLHGLAADILAQSKGPWGYGAKELAECLPRAFREVLTRRHLEG